MSTANIYFSDKSSLTVNDGDHITPIVPIRSDEGNFASMSEPIELYDHIHDGLIPSLMDALCFCDYFYLNDDRNVVYSSRSIVKIESC